ncbi:MAG: hypothetical protein WC007_00260 [Pelobacteraceae bacterium]
MTLIRSLTGIAAILLGLYTSALSAIYTIDNPADKIDNPANKIYNPATDIKNPASTIYNPASRMDNSNPLSSPTLPIPAPQPVEQVKEQLKLQPRLAIPHKNYHFKTVRVYISEAKKAFNQDDYVKFLSITEDALRRINSGTLKASEKAKQKLEKYKVFGYGLLEKG